MDQKTEWAVEIGLRQTELLDNIHKQLGQLNHLPGALGVIVVLLVAILWRVW
jgi:hypothetical protein